MPKPTFMNLPEDKRQRIVEAAMDEFVQYAYDQASINRIVEATGIAKGSFYQYFEDKKDLYGYLIQRGVEEKVAFLQPLMGQTGELDFFQLIRALFMAGWAYAKANPKMTAIANRLLNDPNHPVYQELMATRGQDSDDAFKLLIAKAIEKKELRSDIDIEIAALMLSQTGAKLSQRYGDMSRENWENEYSQKLDAFLELLKNGLGA